MIANLRRKFVFIAMLSTLVVLSAVMGTVNISNYIKMVKRADNMTALLARDGGISTEDSEIEPDNSKTSAEKPDKKPEEAADEESKEEPPEKPEGQEQPEADGIEDGGMSPETPFDTRYFSVTIDENGSVVSSDLNQIAAVDEEEAEEYAKEASLEKNTEGFLGIYRYRLVESEDGTVCVFLDCRKEISSFKNVLFTTLTVSALGLAAVLVLVMFFSRLVFRPVEESLKKQKQFITDASHELKTPLTIIDANTEVMEMISGETKWTKSTRKQVQRLSILVQQLVTLTRLDEGRDDGEKMEFSLSEAVEETVNPYEAPAKISGKKLELMIEDGIIYVGNERLIRQLVGILVDNAVKYTPENGRIAVTLKRKGKKIFLEVYNDASEMPQGKLDVLFERFYRLDSSRNSNTGGTGIGLSVAKAIVQTHRGKITAQSPNGKSLVIQAVL